MSNNNPILSFDDKAQSFFGGSTPKYWHQIHLKVNPNKWAKSGSIVDDIPFSIIDYYSDDNTPITTLEEVRALLTPTPTLHTFAWQKDGTTIEGQAYVDGKALRMKSVEISSSETSTIFVSTLISSSSADDNWNVIDCITEGSGETHSTILYGMRLEIDDLSLRGPVVFSPFQRYEMDSEDIGLELFTHRLELASRSRVAVDSVDYIDEDAINFYFVSWFNPIGDGIYPNIKYTRVYVNKVSLSGGAFTTSTEEHSLALYGYGVHN